MKFLKWVVSLGIITLPLYFFPSGGPQISHILFLFLFLFLFFAYKSRLFFDRSVLVLTLFLVFVFLREAISIIYFGADIYSLNFFIFTFFNLILFSYLIIFLKINEINNIISNSVLISVLLSSLGVIMLSGFSFTYSNADDGVERAVGFFNNPNQLGYYSVCIFSLLTLLFYVKKINTYKWVFGVVLSLFLCAASLSKAAMVSLIFSLILVIMTLINKKNIYIYFFFLFVATLFLLKLSSLIDWDDLTFIRRLQGIGSDNDDSLEGRGYHAILYANAWEIIFGLGYEKTLNIVGHEVHSTYMSILISYGLIGFIFFVVFNFIIFSKCFTKFGFIKMLVLFMPTFMYGITHNGSRFTVFWLFLAFLYYLSISVVIKDDKYVEKNI